MMLEDFVRLDDLSVYMDLLKSQNHHRGPRGFKHEIKNLHSKFYDAFCQIARGIKNEGSSLPAYNRIVIAPDLLHLSASKQHARDYLLLRDTIGVFQSIIDVYSGYLEITSAS